MDELELKEQMGGPETFALLARVEGQERSGGTTAVVMIETDGEPLTGHAWKEVDGTWSGTGGAQIDGPTGPHLIATGFVVEVKGEASAFRALGALVGALLEERFGVATVEEAQP